MFLHVKLDIISSCKIASGKIVFGKVFYTALGRSVFSYYYYVVIHTRRQILGARFTGYLDFYPASFNVVAKPAL